MARRVSRRYYRITAGLTVLALGALAALVAGLQRDLARTTAVLSRLEEKAAAREDSLRELEGRLGTVGRELVDVRRLEASTRRKLLAAIASQRGQSSQAIRDELNSLEERVVALRRAAEEHAGVLAAAEADDDVERRYRALLAPTVRIGARRDYGSGTLLWSHAEAGRVTTYVLTAWHVVAEDATAERELEVDAFAGGERIRAERGRVVAHDVPLDLALIEVQGEYLFQDLARLPTRGQLDELRVFSPVYAIGCPLGYSPLPTRGELTSRAKEQDGVHYWMINAPTIFGNSGGGIYDARTHAMVGVLSRISAYNRRAIDVAVPHMGLVLPLDQVYDWLEQAGFGFVVRERLREASLPASAPR